MKVVVFDFDGVLADSFDALYRFNREAMASVSVELSPDQYRSLFDLNVHRGFRAFIPDDATYRQFVTFKKENFKKYYEDVDLFPGASELIRSIASTHTLAIVSATLTPYIIRLLEKQGIVSCFKRVIGSHDYSKAKSIEMIRDSLGSSYEAMAMVSDTTGDLAVAKDLGLKTIAVTWGFHTPEKLSVSPVDFSVSTFTDLKKVLTTL